MKYPRFQWNRSLDCIYRGRCTKFDAVALVKPHREGWWVDVETPGRVTVGFRADLTAALDLAQSWLHAAFRAEEARRAAARALPQMGLFNGGMTGAGSRG